MREVDVAVVGAGTAGLRAFRTARKGTSSVVLIDKEPLGTTCARVGCMPSKLLIAASEAAEGVRRANEFGVRAAQLQVDGERVMQRVQRERDRFVASVRDSLSNIPEDAFLCAHARFESPHELALDDGRRISARRIVLAVGSRPQIPSVFDGVKDRLDTTDSLFEWTSLPRSVVVFGAGAIGIELGQALHRLGVHTRVVGKGGDLGPLTDPALLRLGYRIMGSELPFEPDAADMRVTPCAAGVEVAVDGGPSEQFERALVAVGRTSSLDRLHLDCSGIDLDGQGRPTVNPYTMQVEDSHVFVVGDATAPGVLHDASDEGGIAGENAGRFPEIRTQPRKVPVQIAFCSPNLATVGRKHHDVSKLLESGSAEVGEVDFGDQGRSRAMAINQGALRVYARRGTGELLGAELLAPRGEHLAHLLAWAMQSRLTLFDLLEMPFYHPTVEEGLRSALRDAAGRLRMGPRPPKHCLDLSPGG